VGYPQIRIDASVECARGLILAQVWEETAAAQAGILTRHQAVSGGLSPDAIRVRMASGRWQRVYPGVIATFSGPLTRPAQSWAAVLVAGPHAMLSHESAAELAGLIPAAGPSVHVTVPLSRRVIPPPAIVVHRSSYAVAHPALRPPRTRIDDTVIDLTQSSTDLETATGWLVRAVAARLTTTPRLLEAIAARYRVRSRHELVAVLADVAEGCHSVLELRYLRRVERAHGLPRGRRQHRRGRWYDDVDYAEFGVSVELDGRAAHPPESAFRDHRRDNAAVLVGSRVLRYGHADVARRPCAIAAEVAAVLRIAGWRGRPHGCGPTCPVNQSGNLVVP
jgi:very-short-patch-repair endonuclease